MLKARHEQLAQKQKLTQQQKSFFSIFQPLQQLKAECIAMGPTRAHSAPITRSCHLNPSSSAAQSATLLSTQRFLK